MSPAQRFGIVAVVLVLCAIIASACAPGPAGDLTGAVSADGSSTVFPITEAVAEEFLHVQGRVRVTVGIAGTGGGFQRFCRGETEVQNASRPIGATEVELCAQNGVDWIELPVAYDALTVVVSPKNDWVDCLTTEELRRIWEPDAQRVIMNWNQVRDGFPDRPLRLYGAGTDSGSFDYFTEVINGKSKSSRGDYTASEDDNTLVQGVSGDTNALGYFGLAYYQENRNLLKAVTIDSGNGCVEPSAETVERGIYTPLSRPLLIYVRREAADAQHVAAFVDFYMENAGFLAGDVGFVSLPERLYDLVNERWQARTTGSLYTNAAHGVTLEQLLGQ